MTEQRINEDPLAWQGAIDQQAPLMANLPEGDKAAPIDFWFSCMVPTYAQNGDSCVGHAWANWIEGMVRRWKDPLGIPPGFQIDGGAIWAQGRKMFWNGNMKGGLYIEQGYEAAVALGWLPKASKLVRVPQDWDSVSRALRASPMVQGHKINKGWFNPDPKSGCIDHTAGLAGAGGHATLLMATLEQKDSDGVLTRWRVLLNSWGANKGRYGFFTMTDAVWLKGAIDDCPYTAEIEDIEAWDSWAEGLIEK